MIQILLSTFNGEAYLCAQLNSFLELQAKHSIKVLIRDDGSNDGTIQILKQYRENFGFELLFGENLGVNQSILELLKYCDPKCDYYALSDQDDIWLPKKFEIGLNALVGQNPKIPALFGSCSQLVDAEGNPIGTTLEPSRTPCFYNAMIQNVIPGHTQIFNHSLMELLQKTKNIGINVIDWWIYLLASGTGKVFFTKEFTVLHRQHGGNTVGYEQRFFHLLLIRLTRLMRGEPKKVSMQLQSFHQQYADMLYPEYSCEILKFLDNQKNLYSRIKYLLTKNACRQSKRETLIFCGLYLIGAYRTT